MSSRDPDWRNFDWSDSILHLDDEIVVVNKPAGVLSQPALPTDLAIADYITEYLLRSNPEREGLILSPAHRLDRNVSGAILLTASTEASRRVHRALQGGNMRRNYLAVVKGDPGPEGLIDAPLAKDEEMNQSFVDESGKPSLTKFRNLARLASVSVLEVNLLSSGRSHQIRAHLAHIGCPILGDRKYAKRPWDRIFDRPALHAREIILQRQSTEQFVAPVPQDLLKLIKSMGGESTLLDSFSQRS